VFALSGVFSDLPERHAIGGLRLFPSNMQLHSFSKRQLAEISLMLGEEEKNAALSDKKKRMWVQNCFRIRKSEDEYWTLFKELADDEMKFYRHFRMPKHQFNYLLQKIEKDLKKKNATFRETISPVEKLATCLR
jgi:hypothetical protein